MGAMHTSCKLDNAGKIYMVSTAKIPRHALVQYVRIVSGLVSPR